MFQLMHDFQGVESGSRTYVLIIINGTARLSSRGTYISFASLSTYADTVLQLQLFDILASVLYYVKAYQSFSVTDLCA